MIKLTHLNKIYLTPSGPVSALNDVNLTVGTGHICGVIGSSGAGKSTLIRCVNLLEKPSTGQVIIDGDDLTQLDTNDLRIKRQKISMIFQHFNLLASASVFDNIALPLRFAGVDKQSIRNTVYSLLELVELSHKLENYPCQLSGGQKQRVAIARALATKPSVLLCDEATSALDPHTTESILKLLKNINHEFNLTILLITHEMQVIKSLCDHVALLEHGQIVEQNSVINFFTAPQTTVAKNVVRYATEQMLPEALQNALNQQSSTHGRPVLQLRFKGMAASQPILAEAIKKFSTEFNILQANIEYIQNEPIGTMVVVIERPLNNIDQVKQFLMQQNVLVEVLGYVE